MKLIVGLGNPGEKYIKTRHNLGFVIVDAFARELGASAWKREKKFVAEVARREDIILLKPQTFMNESGRAVAAVAQFYKIKPGDIYIVHDDLDITLGQFKLQLARGPLLHYGVESVERELGTQDFWRMRAGVENRAVRGNSSVPGEKYSLQDFEPQEREIVAQVAEEIVARLIDVLS